MSSLKYRIVLGIFAGSLTAMSVAAQVLIRDHDRLSAERDDLISAYAALVSALEKRGIDINDLSTVAENAADKSDAGS